MQEKINCLANRKIFAPLTDQQLAGLAGIVRAYEFQAGSVIAYPRDVVEHFYIVAEGHIETFVVDEAGVIVDSTRYSADANGYFEDIWLFEQKDHKSTVRAASDGLLYTIDRGDFARFLDDYPEVELDMPDEIWDEIDNVVIDETDASFRSTIALMPDEVIEYESRRTGILLAWYLLPPALLILLMPIGFLALMLGLFALPFSLWLGVIALVITIPFFLYALYRYLDWSNDHLVITSQQLVHTEFDLSTFSGSVLKIPLDQVQSVKVLKPSIIETMLGVGTVSVGTASQMKGLKFDNIGNPNEVEHTLSRIRQRESALDEGRTRTAVREALEDYFQVPDQVQRVEGDNAPLAASSNKKRNGKAKRRGNRSEEGGVITYGRHWIVLLQLMWWVLGLLLLTIVGMGAALIFLPVLRLPVTFIAGGAFLLVLAGIFYYYYEDWANDVFQLTSDSIVDIDRGPLGLTESRKTAPLENVQNVQADRPNFWATVFGYGNVLIETAGASADLQFENVANPNQIQADIFARRELIRKNKTRSDARERQHEFTLMIDEYQQLREQEKIPARTPHVDRRAVDDDNIEGAA